MVEFGLVRPKDIFCFGNGNSLKLWMELWVELKKHCIVARKFSECVMVLGRLFSKGEGCISICVGTLDRLTYCKILKNWVLSTIMDNYSVKI